VADAAAALAGGVSRELNPPAGRSCPGGSAAVGPRSADVHRFVGDPAAGPAGSAGADLEIELLPGAEVDQGLRLRRGEAGDLAPVELVVNRSRAL